MFLILFPFGINTDNLFSNFLELIAALPSTAESAIQQHPTSCPPCASGLPTDLHQSVNHFFFRLVRQGQKTTNVLIVFPANKYKIFPNWDRQR